MPEVPQPPYNVAMPPRWADTPYQELPRGLQRRVERHLLVVEEMDDPDPDEASGVS